MVLDGESDSLCAFEDIGASNRPKDALRLQAAFDRFAETGVMKNPEVFKHVAGKIYEFKNFQHRFLGFFDPHGAGKDFVICAYVRKKKDKLPSTVLDRAVARMELFLEQGQKRRAHDGRTVGSNG